MTPVVVAIFLITRSKYTPAMMTFFRGLLHQACVRLGIQALVVK